MYVPDASEGGAPDGAPAERVVAWRPPVPGVAEVLHARFVQHAYPEHCHDTWALLVVDTGSIRFDLDRREHGGVPARTLLLPPHVAHTGRAGTEHGFVKRVAYLDTSVLPAALGPRVVRAPALADPLLRTRVGQLHRALTRPGGELEAESRLALIGDRLRLLLGAEPEAPGAATGASRRLADDLRSLLDERLVPGVTLREASALLHAHPDSLVRAFTAAFGLPPHRYLTGRRVEAARRRLLTGEAPASVAAAVGFHDQAHLTRHFTRLLGSTPARYAASGRPGPGRRS